MPPGSSEGASPSISRTVEKWQEESQENANKPELIIYVYGYLKTTRVGRLSWIKCPISPLNRNC